jgi:hypothetical protein
VSPEPIRQRSEQATVAGKSVTRILAEADGDVRSAEPSDDPSDCEYLYAIGDIVCIVEADTQPLLEETFS